MDLDGAETVSDVVDRLNTALGAIPGGTVSASYDATAGQIVLTDSNTTLTDDGDVTTLFGSASVDSDASDEIAFETSGLDFAAGYSFDVAINGGDPVNVTLAADATRSTAEGFAAALNEAMLSSAVARTDLSDTGIPLTQVALFQLVRVHVDGGGNLVLAATDFADVNGFDEMSFTVQGVDTAHEVSFTVTELAGSNAATALGFASGVAQTDELRSAKLYDSPSIGRPITFVDTGTNGTKLRAQMTLGAPDGLNVVLALGPIEAAVEGGQAFIGSSDGDGKAGFIEASIRDVDGVDDGRLDLLELVKIADDQDRSFLDLFGLEIDLATNVNLPFSGAFGLLNPDLHGFTYEAALVETVGPDPVSFTQLYDITDEASVRDLFQGDAIELFFEGTVSDPVSYNRVVDLRLPDFGNLLDCKDIFQLLNDPNAVLNGLDMIFSTIQSSIEATVGGIDLPIIGDNLMMGANFFRDLQFDLIDPARDWIAELNTDGSVRTTADLVEVLMNGYLNEIYEEILGLPAATPDQQFIQLETSPDDAEDPYIFGAISFDFRVFEEALDIGFDLDLPGLDFGVDDASAITLSADLVVNLGFGLDCNGFFILNDTAPIDANDAGPPEVGFVITADAGGFDGQLNIGEILGLKATAGADDAYVKANIGIDLFGDDGTEGRDYSALNLAGRGGVRQDDLCHPA